MKKAKRIIVANWKMNPQTLEEARKIWSSTRRDAEKLKNTLTIVCPPAVYLPNFAKLSRPKIKVGSQDAFWEEKGSFTSQISPTMLRALGVTHAIIGHSERRALGDTNEMVAKKVSAVIRQEITAVLCVGESIRDNEGNFLSFLKEQLLASLKNVQKKHLFYLVIAYEPVWAIGKSDREALDGHGMHEMLIFIRKILNDVYGAEYASKVPILYGGSATPLNVEDLVKNGHVDGLILGRPSIEPKVLSEISKIVDSIESQE